MKTATNYDYDEDNDILYIYKKSEHGSKVKGSLDVGNFIIDLTHDNNVSGLEVLDFSEVLKNFGIKKPKEVLQNIQRVQIRAVYTKSSIVIYYVISYKLKNKEEKIGASVAVPVGN